MDRLLGLLNDAIDQLGKANLVLTGGAIAMVAGLWFTHRNDYVDFVLSLVISSPFLAAMLALPIMSWVKLLLHDAPMAAVFGGRRYMFNSLEVRMMFVKGYPWARLDDVCKILRIKGAERVVKHFTLLECDSHEDDHDWLSETGVARLLKHARSTEAESFSKWFEKEVAAQARKARDKGKAFG